MASWKEEMEKVKSENEDSAEPDEEDEESEDGDDDDDDDDGDDDDDDDDEDDGEDENPDDAMPDDLPTPEQQRANLPLSMTKKHVQETKIPRQSIPSGVANSMTNAITNKLDSPDSDMLDEIAGEFIPKEKYKVPKKEKTFLLGVPKHDSGGVNMKPPKAVNQVVSSLIDKVAKDYEQGSKRDIWADLTKQYETVKLRIRKKQADTKKFAYFTVLENLQPDFVAQTGIEEICSEEGGRGEYEVDVMNNQGATLASLGPVVIAGAVSHDVPKSQREGGAPLPGIAGAIPALAAQGGGGPGIKDFLGYINQQNASTSNLKSQSEDRMMAMMMNQQAQMMGFFALLMGGGGRQGGATGGGFGQSQEQPNTEMQALKEELSRMREESREKDRQAAIEKLLSEQRASTERQFAELKLQQGNTPAVQQLIQKTEESRMLDIMRMIMDNKNKGGDNMAVMAQIFGSMQEMSRESSERMIKMLMQMLDKPSEDEKMSKIMEVASNSAVNQLQLVQSILNSKLMGEKSETSASDIVKQVIDGATQIGVTLLSKGQPDQGQYEQEEDDTPQLPPGVESQSAIPAPGHQAAMAPASQVEMGAAAGLQEQNKQASILTQEELDSVGADSALRHCVALVANGESVSEVVARIYAHAVGTSNLVPQQDSKILFDSPGGHPVARKWLENPVQAGYAILTHYNVPSPKISDLIENMIGFCDYANKGGDANKWADTGYRPLKRQVILPPDKVEKYDPTVPKTA